jgi:hypothetical protein
VGTLVPRIDDADHDARLAGRRERRVVRLHHRDAVRLHLGHRIPTRIDLDVLDVRVAAQRLERLGRQVGGDRPLRFQFVHDTATGCGDHVPAPLKSRNFTMYRPSPSAPATELNSSAIAQ